MAKNKAFAPIVLLFVLLNALLMVFGRKLSAMGADNEVLIWGNVFLFLITLASFLIARRGLTHPNPHRFTQAVYTSILAKLFICAIAAGVYIAMAGKGLNKPAFFALMALYLVYSFLEVNALTTMLRRQTNA